MDALEMAELNYDSAVEDLKSMGAHLMILLVKPDEACGPVAWWLCSNYPRDVFKAPMYRDIRALAEAYKAPPRGTWEQWFSRDVIVK